MSSTQTFTSANAPASRSLPTELQTSRRWVCWESEDSAKKLIPPSSGEAVTSHDDLESLNWAIHRSATQDHEGVAIVLKQMYVAVRLIDAVIQGSSKPSIENWAVEVIESIDSYTEICPNGDDVLLLSKGRGPQSDVDTEGVEI